MMIETNVEWRLVFELELVSLPTARSCYRLHGKQAILLVVNERLVCRKPHQRGVASTYRDMYKLKWKANLADVEVSDGSVKNSNKIERETLHADFITMNQISE